jgi:chlorophyllide a reductase subunit Y
MAGKGRFDTMTEFFEGVGSGDATGIWEDTPQDRPEFRAEYKRRIEKEAKKRKAEEMI